MRHVAALGCTILGSTRSTRSAMLLRVLTRSYATSSSATAFPHAPCSWYTQRPNNARALSRLDLPHARKDNSMKRLEYTRLRPRPGETISLQVPQDVVASLKKGAANRDMSVEALLKLYIGQGFRQDLAKLFSDRMLERTAEVLSRHVPSEKANNVLHLIRHGSSSTLALVAIVLCSTSPQPTRVERLSLGAV